MTDLVGGERRLLRDLEAGQAGDRADRLDADEIVRREHGATCSAGMRNAADARVRDRAAHERDVAHPGQPNVGDELPASAHQAIVFLADQTGPDTLCGHCDARCALGVGHFGVAASAASRAIAVAKGEGSSNGPAGRCAA